MSDAEIVQPRVILKKLSDETVKQIYQKDSNEEGDLTRTQMVERINASIEKSGVTILFETMKRDDLKSLATQVNVHFKESDNQNSKAVLAKKLKDKIQDVGFFEDLLAEYADTALLNKLCQTLDETPESTNKDVLVRQVVGIINSLGAEQFWNSFDVNVLHNVTADLKLKAKGTNSKRKLVDSILTNSNPEKAEPKKKKRKITYSKKKKPLEKGITYDDIFQHYYVNEVRDYCKANGLKSSGKKKELINRILAYLNGEEEETSSKKKSSKDESD